MASNGRLTAADLAPINNGRLRRGNGSAASWNAMCGEARRRGMTVPVPAGPNSSYRTYERQVYYWHNQPPVAAYPGTSNHGWANAVDVSQPAGVSTVKRIGAKYGWYWGEAPSEWWHTTYRGGYSGPNPGPGGLEPPLKRGSRGSDVKALQKRLKRLGFHPLRTDGHFGLQTEQIVKRFQHNREMKADGVVGPGTQKELKRALQRIDLYRCTPTERKMVGRWYARHRQDALGALVKYRRRLYKLGERDGWRKHDRKVRYQTLVHVTKNHPQLHVR